MFSCFISWFLSDVSRPQGPTRSYPQRLRRPLCPSPVLLQLPGQGDHVGRGVEVEFDRRQLLDSERDSPLAGRLDMAVAAALAEGRNDRVRRAEEGRLGAGAVAVGDDADGVAGDAGEQTVELARGEQRTVAGHQDNPDG